MQTRLAILTDVYFRRLKINHDTHELILEFGTVANSKYLQGVCTVTAENKVKPLFAIPVEGGPRK